MIFFLSIFLLRSSIILKLDIILVIDYKLDVGLEGDQMMVCCVFCCCSLSSCLMLKFQNKTVVCGVIIPRSQSSFQNLTCLAVRVSGAWRVKNSE